MDLERNVSVVFTKLSFRKRKLNITTAFALTSAPNERFEAHDLRPQFRTLASRFAAFGEYLLPGVLYEFSYNAPSGISKSAVLRTPDYKNGTWTKPPVQIQALEMETVFQLAYDALIDLQTNTATSLAEKITFSERYIAALTRFISEYPRELAVGDNLNNLESHLSEVKAIRDAWAQSNETL